MSGERVLVVRVGAMGDVLHALHGVTALRFARPEWEIGWAVEPRWASLLVNEGEARGPVVDRIHQVRTTEWKRAPLSIRTATSIAELRRELRAAEYGACVDMQGTIRSAVIARMPGAKRLVGQERPRERAARWMYGERVETHHRHVVEQGSELLEALAGQALPEVGVQLPVSEPAEAWCDAVLEGMGRFCVMAPTAGWGAKVWPAERYGAVARELADRGYGVVVNAVGAHDPVAAAVVQASGGAARAVPSTVPEMVALMRRANLAIAGDTGPLHLAAALRRPVVGLFGPTDPARNGPYGTRSRVLRHDASETDHRRVPGTEAGLLQIGVGEVVMAATEMLGDETGGLTSE